MIFDILTPTQGPMVRDSKKCAVACAIHVSYAHTKLVEFRGGRGGQ